MKDGSSGFFAGFTAAAHRGASGLFPENTLDAFRAARTILPGCLLETDVRPTADGAIIIMHDEFLNLKTNGSGAVSGRSLDEIRTLDAGYKTSFDGGATYPFRGRGYRIPLLSEALDAFPDARFSIDIKDRDPGLAGKVMSIIREHGADGRVIVGSFHDAVMRYVRSNFKGVITSYSKMNLLGFLASQKLGISRLARRRADAMLIPEIFGGRSYEFIGRGKTGGMRVITPRFISAAHRLGIPVLAWTINRPENMRRLIDWGIDGIVTDHIDVLKEVMAEKGLL
jgi:glycerophosphoryl diester phosphodiesterase